uniref:Uncharacterized protein n=1 Tax=Glossina pallidipes TaxID=7398 RepID=A0A1B0A1F9_GLOPL
MNAMQIFASCLSMAAVMGAFVSEYCLFSKAINSALLLGNHNNGEMESGETNKRNVAKLGERRRSEKFVRRTGEQTRKRLTREMPSQKIGSQLDFRSAEKAARSTKNETDDRLKENCKNEEI